MKLLWSLSVLLTWIWAFPGSATPLGPPEFTKEEALVYFDGLDDIPSLAHMFGWWKGSEVPTGHRFDGSLTAAGAYGKNFVSETEVYPLVFYTAGRRKVYYVGAGPPYAEGEVGWGQDLRWHDWLAPFTRIGAILGRPIFETKEPGATITYKDTRGMSNVFTMEYNGNVVNDYMRCENEDCSLVFGFMNNPFKQDGEWFFRLEKDPNPPPYDG